MFWWLLIPAILLAIFSEKIDIAVKADNKLKKVILVFSAGVIVVCAIAIIVSQFAR